jgi:hypothetical protein
VSQPDLWARILDALRTKGVDANEFEVAAFVFLKDSFPTLSPVSGGTDFGRDADALDGDDVVRLLATTAADPRNNLRNGLRRMREEGLLVSDVVLATSQPVSATRRRQLETIAEEFGVRLVMVYDQAWLASELYRHADWRERLIGVTGEPPALTPVPLSLADSHLPAVELVGRDDALSHIRGADSDLIVVGSSGMGKTRLLADMDDSVFVELHGDAARIADDIRRLAPSAVVLDDAHDHPGTMNLLRRIRQAGPPQFRIIATTWPDTVEAVRDHLPDADELILTPLERTENARILEDLGITNQLLVGDILDQAEGRPGWTLVLGDLARQEGVQRVLTGDALIEQVGRFSRRLARGSVALDLLARVAVLGHVTDEELSQLADEVGLPLAEAVEQLKRLTRHGLAEWSQGRWTVRPSRLRAALVAHHFFSEPPTASLDALIAGWPEKTLTVAASIVSAALVGSAAAHRAGQALLQQLADEGDLLGDESGELLYSYALTSPQAASWVIEYLADGFPEGPPSPPTSREDLLARLDTYRERARWERAAAAADAAAQKFALPEAFDLLARMALQDDGPTNHSDHPRRRLVELPTRIGPYWGTDRDLRREALHCAVRLAQTDVRDAGDLAAELASAALSPQGQGSWLDPVDRYKFAWVDRLESAGQLEWIAGALWPVWRGVIDGLSDTAVSRMLDLVRAWQRLAAEGDNRLQPTEEAKEAARRHATEMLRAIRNRCQQSPGLATAWNDRLKQLPEADDLESIEIDEDFSALVPDLELSWREREAERRQRIPQVADDLNDLDPHEIAERLSRWSASAEAGGQHIGMSLAQLLEELGKRGTPTELLLEVLAREELRQHAYALAATALEADSDRWQDWVCAGLNDPQQRGLVASTVLTAPSVPDEAITHTLNELDARDAWLLEQILIRRGQADTVVEALLTHTDLAVRSETALEFRLGDMSHGLDLPDDWYERWREAFLAIPLDLEGPASWRFEELAKSLAAIDPDLLTEWFLRSLADTSLKLSHEAIKLLGHLPPEHRRGVLIAAADHPARRWLICAAIADHPGSVVSLLDDDVVDVEDVMLCIERDHRGAWFEAVAPELVRRGADPGAVAIHLQFGTGIGHESEVYTTLADYLAGLVGSDIPDLAEVGRVGEAALREEATEAAAKEREDRIRGR